MVQLVTIYKSMIPTNEIILFLFNLENLGNTKNGDSMNVLITGASSGIGFSLAVRLAKRGHFIYLATHTKKEMLTAIKKIKEIHLENFITTIKLDITKSKDRTFVEKLELDGLINLAGIGIGGSFLDLPQTAIKQNFEVNFFATTEITKQFINHYSKKKLGKVLITSSLAGILPIPNLGSYCTTKSALITMAKCLKKEVIQKKKNIRIKLIEPGAYATGFNEIMLNYLEEKNYQRYQKIFRLFEKKHTRSIEKQMVRALESNSKHLCYKAPFLQRVAAKLYAIFFI